MQSNRNSGDIPDSTTANLYLIDTRSLAANTGGAIVFSSYYQGTVPVSGGSYIKGYKENATSGDYGYGLKFGVRTNGSGTRSPCFIINSTETATFTSQLIVEGAGNTSKGNIAMGAQTSGANKWSYLTGAHYNQTTGSGNGSGSAGIALIGSYGSNTENRVVIGGSIYESNPSTSIEFWTHTATTHTTGGTRRIVIDSNGLNSFHNMYLTGSVDRRIKLSDSGVSGVTTSDNAVYVRGNDDDLILNCAGNGQITFTDNGVEGMKLLNNTLSVQGDVIAYSSSDYRLKDNVKEIDNALDKVSQIRGVEFDWNENQTVYEGHDIGVIAQEVEKVAPEIVVTRDDGYKAVNYQKLTALLIEAVKELKEEIKELKKDK